MKLEEIKDMCDAYDEYKKKYSIFANACRKVILYFSEIEDTLDKSMQGILYDGNQLFINEINRGGYSSPCRFEYDIFSDHSLVIVKNINFDYESTFDVKWLFMTEEELKQEVMKIVTQHQE